MKVIPFPGPRSSAAGSGTIRRLNLPVAPYTICRMRFESSASSVQVLVPEDALVMLDEALGRGLPVESVEITGPGDPLASPRQTLETLRLVRGKYPGMGTSLTTIGIGGLENAGQLAEAGLDRIILRVDAVSPEVGGQLYLWIRPGTRTVPLLKAVQHLLEQQAAAVASFKQAGVKVRIRTTIYPGVNEDHIEAIASRLADLGADEMEVQRFSPPGNDEGLSCKAGDLLLAEARVLAARHLKVVEPAGTPAGMAETVQRLAGAGGRQASLPKPSPGRPNVAVVSSNGMEIDLHLGEAIKVMIYGPREDGLHCLLDIRPAPEPGGGPARWEELAAKLSDCFVLLAASAGKSPAKILPEHGLRLMIFEGNVDGAVDVLYGGGKKGRGKR
jgi:nitrogen fixation protein NifB